MTSTPARPLDVLIDLVVKKTHAERARVRPESRFIDFGLNSVTSLELVIDVEQALGIEIPDKDLVELHTLGQLARYLERRLGKKPG